MITWKRLVQIAKITWQPWALGMTLGLVWCLTLLTGGLGWPWWQAVLAVVAINSVCHWLCWPLLKKDLP